MVRTGSFAVSLAIVRLAVAASNPSVVQDPKTPFLQAAVTQPFLERLSTLSNVNQDFSRKGNQLILKRQDLGEK
jgi:hypothetical protein